MIPLLPLLPPTQYLHIGRVPRRPLPFPLDCAPSQVRMYYFARNGVWEAARALGLQTGDEVLMPTYTSGIEVDALVAYGAVPVFYRLTPDLAPDFNDAQEKLSTRTKLFYLIHYFGFPQPFPKVLKFCREYGLKIFEDNALGFLSADEAGNPLGSMGDVGLLCPRKTIPLPHGGILVANSPDVHLERTPQVHPSWYSTVGETLSLFVRHAVTRETATAKFAASFQKKGIPRLKKALAPLGLQHIESGGPQFDVTKVNWGMSPISSSLLPTFDYASIIERRRTHYQSLTRLLRDLDGRYLRILFPHLPAHTCPLEYMIVVDNLERVTNALTQANIEFGLHWWWDRPQQIGKQDPQVEPLLTRGILLPVHQDLREHDIQNIAEVIRDAVK